MEELASLFMHSRTQAHVFHLRVKGPGSHAAHLALQAYYEGIIPLLDGRPPQFCSLLFFN